MFLHANIAWSYLLQASIDCVITHYGITVGVLVLDDSDKTRSRNTSKISGVHKVKDKKTGGWFIRRNQLVRSRGKSISLTTYFLRQSGVTTTLIIRGGEEKNVTMLSARLIVKSHRKKRFVIALKYEGETEYRFIVASDLTWRHKDIVQAYTLRWLVEVFIADWKGHGGWNTLSKQQGDESATRGVILSLLCDHLLLLHPLQSARIKNKQPGMPVGCLIEHINAAALLNGVSYIVNAEQPKNEFEKFKILMEQSLPDKKSTKHLAGRDLGRLEPTISLKYQKAA
ncbi:MAG: hypothetical protein ABI091_24590 [Ferruginibacter sp.]